MSLRIDKWLLQVLKCALEKNQAYALAAIQATHEGLKVTAVICLGAFTPPTQAALKTVGAQKQGQKELQQFKVIFGRGAVRSKRERHPGLSEEE